MRRPGNRCRLPGSSLGANTQCVRRSKIAAKVFQIATYRARTTSFLVQTCTCPQWAQLNFWVFTLVVSHNCSSMVCPVGVSFAVEGHLTNRRLMTGPFFCSVVIIKFLSKAVNNPRFVNVIGGHFHLNPITHG